MRSPDYAFIARGKLFVCLAGEEPRELESPFAVSVATRTERIARRHAWKRGGSGARFMLGVGDIPDEALDPLPAASQVTFSGVSRGRYEAELVYCISSGPLSGLFAFAGGEETRLYHGADHHLSAPSCAPDGSRIACVLSDKGRNHIAIVGADGSDVRQVTDGDAAERAPSWVPGTNRLVFESQPYGYDAAGRVVDLAPTIIQELDLDVGTMRVLAEDAKTDCTSPRVGADGTLYFVKRERTSPRSVSIGKLLVEFVLFPFRLLRALLSFLNIFSIRYSGRPLVSPGAAKQQQGDLRRMIVAGNVLNAEARAAEEAAKERDRLRLGWQLVAKSPSGDERVAAKRVLAFDLCPDGRILYTSGSAVFVVDGDGTESKLRDEEGVTAIVAVAAQENG